MNYHSTLKNIGFFGGMFVRMHQYSKAGDSYAGHRHVIDHMTLVSQGGVICETDEMEPKEYWAPAIIEIAREVQHRFTALADNTVYFCVFATDHLEETKSGWTQEQIQDELCGDCKGCSR
jgi:quercetin dioxygenase-like cupin family protein